jgi:glycosyltransferase involved in cell wall biosynthesis
MKILRILGSLNPEIGGPVEAAFQQTAEMVRQGHQVDTITMDTGNEDYVKRFPGNVIALGPSQTGYRFSKRLIPWLEQNCQNYDFVLVHGIWQYLATAVWWVYKKKKFSYFVYTHGSLDPWFKQAFPLKHFKKWLSWQFIDGELLHNAVGVLFTSEEERRLAMGTFAPYQVNEIVVDYGTKAPPTNKEALKEAFFATYPSLRGKRLLLFMSRIHPKKGCDLLLEAFSKICGEHPDLQLVIAGPDQVNLVSILKKRAEELGISGRVFWPGMLKGDPKWGALYAADVFILPSHSENFGVVLAEAMSCRVPVLTTTKVNIWREIQTGGAGLIGEDDLEGVTNILKDWIEMPVELQERMRGNAENTFLKRFEITQTVKNTITTLQDQLERSKIDSTL